MNLPKVVMCHNHKYAPYSFVCKHLVDGTSNRWCFVEVDDGREVEADWACPDCFAIHDSPDFDADLLRVICIHCCRDLQEQHHAVFIGKPTEGEG